MTAVKNTIIGVISAMAVLYFLTEVAPLLGYEGSPLPHPLRYL